MLEGCWVSPKHSVHQADEAQSSQPLILDCVLHTVGCYKFLQWYWLYLKYGNSLIISFPFHQCWSYGKDNFVFVWKIKIFLWRPSLWQSIFYSTIPKKKRYWKETLIFSAANFYFCSNETHNTWRMLHVNIVISWNHCKKNPK